MLRVLTLSTLYPNRAQPGLGPFVERQTRGLAGRDDVALEVFAPIGLAPWPLSRLPVYRSLRSVPRYEERGGLAVHHPRYRVWPRIGHRRRPAALARAVLAALERQGKSRAFDVIDAEFFWPDGPAAKLIAEKLGIPFSVKARGSDIRLWGRRPGIGERIVAAGRAAAGLLAVSARLREEMIALGLPAETIAVHRTGVDLKRFVPVDRASARAALGVGGPLLVTVGNLVPLKRTGIAIAALALLPAATLLVVGAGPERGRLEEAARRAGVAGRVRFLGAVPHADIPALLGAADVLVHPSESEGLANVWVEALACGTPVVACAVGGAAEAIDGPVAGRLVEATPEAFAAAINELLAAPPAPAEVRKAAESFGWDANRDSLFDHLSAAAARR